jgi:O-antigen ligase
MPRRFFHWIVAAALAWGVLAFGAVYPWGYRPLAAVCALAGVSALAIRRVRASVPRTVAAALAIVIIAGLSQVIRIPAGALQRISPATTALLAQYDLGLALHTASSHAASIDPARTWIGVLLLICFSLFWMGLTGLLDERLTVRIAQSVIAIGFVASLLAIAFAGNHNGRVYGFWQPRSAGSPFGPFVNRNHYAGWMLMSTLLGFGYFCALLDDAARARARSWRERIIWLSTSDGSRLIGVVVALATMALSVLLSMSRSGMTLLAMGLLALGIVRARRVVSRWTRAALVCALILFGAASIAWAGADTLAARFSTWQDDSLHGRVAVWRDARALVSQFPVTGTGLNTFGVAMLFYQTTNLHELYAEAHNDYLQLAAEGGLLIGVPALVLIVVTCAEVRRRFREPHHGAVQWIRTGAVAGLLAVGVQDVGDFSLQMPGTAALFCVLAAIALSKTARSLRAA